MCSDVHKYFIVNMKQKLSDCHNAVGSNFTQNYLVLTYITHANPGLLLGYATRNLQFLSQICFDFPTLSTRTQSDMLVSDPVLSQQDMTL